MEQLESQLGALDVQLDDAILDRIDEIVPPGTNFNSADGGYVPPDLTDASLTPPLVDRAPVEAAHADRRSARRCAASSTSRQIQGRDVRNARDERGPHRPRSRRSSGCRR